MTAAIFVDTNVLLYAIDHADQRKQTAARLWRDALWKSRLGRISFQVLEEFYVQVMKKWPNAREAARGEIRDLLTWQPVEIRGEILERAWRLQDRFQLSFWDALIVAAAQSSSCRYLLTEDLQHDQEIDGLRIVSPFACEPDSLLS